jgi:hypothetical protein
MPRRALFACLLALLLALAGCGGGPASGGGDPASAVPRDAAVYVDAAVRPQGAQRADALAAAGKVLATDDPAGKIDELLRQAFAQSDGLKLDYARDIAPWLGEKAGLWLIPSPRGGDPRAAAVLSSTDEDAAQAALDRAVKSSGKPFSKRSYKGVDYVVNDEHGAVAVTGDFVVLGDEPEVKRSLDVLDGGDSLAGDGRYKEAIGRLDDARLGTAYFDFKAVFDAAASSDPQAAQLRRLVPVGDIGPVSVALKANGDELSLDGFAPGGRAYMERFGALSGTGSTPLLGELPADSWAAFGAPRLGQTAKTLYDGAAGALGGAVLDQQLRQQVGLDLEQDVFSWIGDVAFFARGVTKGSVDGGAVIEVTDEARAKAAFGKLIGLVQSRGGVAAKAVSVPGADTAFAIQQPGAPKPLVAALGKERVVVTYGEAAAADALAPRQKLADSETWSQAKALLGDRVEPAFLLSMPAVVELASGSGDPSFAQAKPYLDAFGLIATGGGLEGDVAHSRVVAGLR